MKKVVKRILSVIITLSLMSGTSIISNGKGTVLTDDAEKALARINEIRKEAAKEGILSIWGNSDSMLSYSSTANGVELKWSSEAISMAKKRASECAEIGMISHTRLDGTSAVNCVNGNSLENLSYGAGSGGYGKQTMLDAVELWYSEKAAYLQHVAYVTGKSSTDTTEVWGHYNTMIMNEWTSVGLGTVTYTDGWTYYFTAGEFTNATDTQGAYSNNSSSGSSTTNPNKPEEGGIYRVYNYTKSGPAKHLLSNSYDECDNLVKNHGWKWDNGGKPIFYEDETGVKQYRLNKYDEIDGSYKHVFIDASDTTQLNNATSNGWEIESGSEIYTNPEKTGKAVYRFWNKTTTRHLYTTDTNEVEKLKKDTKWSYDGIVLYSYK